MPGLAPSTWSRPSAMNWLRRGGARRRDSASPRPEVHSPAPISAPPARCDAVRFIVLPPHFAPDTAPTGRVMTRIVEELARRGHRIDVVTALPWYRLHRVESEWKARVARRESTPWGSVTRVNPFAGADKRNLVRRAMGF